VRIVFLGGNQTGCFGLLTLLAKGHSIPMAVPYSESVEQLCKSFNIPTFKIKELNIEYGGIHDPYEYDLLVSVHCRSIIGKDMLDKFRFGGINVHPCLYKYKGADPIGRLLKDGETLASVATHAMTPIVDEGEVLNEIFVDVTGLTTVTEVYNKLYPYYAISLIHALEKIYESTLEKIRG